MAPVVAEVEDELELVARAQLLRDLELRLVLPLEVGRVLVARKADPAPVRKLELVQVREIPASEGGVDRVGWAKV